MNTPLGTQVEITPQAVRAQLGRILSSDAFVRSRRMQRFLEFIVEQALAGRWDQLGEFSIGMAVFDRGPDFEPAVDPIVRNDARRLRLKLLEYYRLPGIRLNDSVLIEVPKGGYVPVFRPICCLDDSATSGEAPTRLAVLPFEVLSGAAERPFEGQARRLRVTAGFAHPEGCEGPFTGQPREESRTEAASGLPFSHVPHGRVTRYQGRCRVLIELIYIPKGAQTGASEFELEISGTFAAHSGIEGIVVREVAACLEPPYLRRDGAALPS